MDDGRMPTREGGRGGQDHRLSPFPMTVQARQAARLMSIATLCIYVSTAGGGLTSVDGVAAYEVTRNLLLHRSFATSTYRDAARRSYSPFGIGQSLFNIPFYVAGRTARQWSGLRVGRQETIEKSAVSLGSAVAGAGTVWIVYLFAWRLGGSLVGARRAALALGFATLMWPYSKFGFNAPLTAWCLTAGIYSMWVGVRLDRRRMLAWAGVCLGCAFLTRHEMAVAALLAAAWTAFESRGDWRRLCERLTWLGLPVVAAFGFWLWYNFARFGNAFDAGYFGDAALSFSDPMRVGIPGLLFTPGRSLFLYTPLTIAGVLALPGLAGRDRSTGALFAGVLTVFLVLYGSLPYWDGLRSYGPRYLVPLLPLLIIPLVWWLQPGGSRWRRALLWLAALSVVVQLPGVIVDFSKVAVAHGRETGNYPRDAKIYNWRESSLVLDLRAVVKAVPINARYLMHGERPPGLTTRSDEDDRAFSRQFDFSLDFWWLYFYYVGVISAPMAVAFGLAPLLAAALVLRHARSQEVLRARSGA